MLNRSNLFNGIGLLLLPLVMFIGIFVCIYEEIDWFFNKPKKDK